MDWIQQWQSKLNKQNEVAPLVRTGGSRHTGLAALPYRNIHRIFENIISNALSHGKSDYHFSSYDDNENYHFSFQNFTDSINESDIDKIFNRFYTTDLSRSRKTTGLGLTIAKNLTVKMGGSISASLNNNVFEIVVCFPKQKG